ncbi:methyltransferase domain-containing protein [Candidatus Beckwithbacteria bacterium]|nr:methyltransferase domain-containing protein [Candidatus Beckwithbacteria bacterium]
MINWKKNIFNNQLKEHDGIYLCKYKKSLAIEFHNKMPKGAALRELQEFPLHLAYWERPYYHNALEKFLSNFRITKETVAVDIGCGDGRFTEYLLKKGFQKIIATDSHIKPLLSLRNYIIKNNFQDKVLIINCSAEDIPIKTESVDLALAIGVFYYLNDKCELAISESKRLLKTKGILINSEPDLSGAIFKSIYFEEIDDLIENFEKRKFKEEKGKTNFKFKLFSQDEISQLLQKSGFNIIDKHGLSLLPSILRIKMVRGELSEDEIKSKENKLRKIFDYFDNKPIYKHIIWKSQKK